MPVNFLIQEPAIFIAWLAAVIIGLAIHEYAHALSATVLGDNTAKMMGRLTLNPLAHIDPIGFIMLLLVGFGWGKPVPYNPYNLKNKKWGSAFISIAGPLSNFIAIIISGLVLKFLTLYHIVLENNLLWQFLLFLMVINVALMIFNLIPIPPLDGSKLLFAVLPLRYDNFKIQLLRNGPWLLLFLVIIDSFSGHSVFGLAFQWILNLIGKLIF
jgi:Zn-dependent protease